MFPMLLKPYQGNTVFHKLHREEDIKSKLSGKQPELLLIHFRKDGGGGGGGRGGTCVATCCLFVSALPKLSK